MKYVVDRKWKTKIIYGSQIYVVLGYKNVPQTPGFYMGNTLFIYTNRKPFSLMNTGTKKPL